MNKNIDKKKVFEFLDRLRETNVTNMLGAGNYIVEEFNVEESESIQYLTE